jgi:hypothetical protein
MTKLHSSLKFNANEKVEVAMNDYKCSKVLEVQQRAFDYWVLRNGQINKDILFSIPLTEK